METMIRRQSGDDLSPRIRDIPLEVNRVVGWPAPAVGAQSMTLDNPSWTTSTSNSLVSFSSMTMK